MRGETVGALHAVPFTAKDTTPVDGVPLTFGMAPFSGNVATTTAPVIRRLEQVGGIFLGITNMPELAYRGVTENHVVGPTQNPWRLGRIAGGS